MMGCSDVGLDASSDCNGRLRGGFARLVAIGGADGYRRTHVNECCAILEV